MTLFWIENPEILLDKNIWPTEDMDKNAKLNAITRLVVVATILGLIITKTYKILITGLITVFAIVILYYSKQKSNTDIEAFTELRKEFTTPTTENPVMNVMITDNPDRKPAAPSYEPNVESSINEMTKNMVSKNFRDPNIHEKLFDDLGDSLEFNQSMRSWHPTANTKIPNDQTAFLKFCYGDDGLNKKLY